MSVICGLCAFTGLTAHAQDAKPAVPAKQLSLEGTSWKSLYDGKTLTGWKQSDFYKGGAVHLEPKFHGDDTAIVVDAGSSLSGFNWTGDAIPRLNYEVSLEMIKISGDDFACGLTFPVGDSFASLILGGWGGSTTGISSLDQMDASENETRKSVQYALNRWYTVRMRVSANRLQAWLDDKKIIDADTTGRKISLRFGDIRKSTPLGIANYQTQSGFRAIKIRGLTPQEASEPAPKAP